MASCSGSPQHVLRKLMTSILLILLSTPQLQSVDIGDDVPDDSEAAETATTNFEDNVGSNLEHLSMKIWIERRC